MKRIRRGAALLWESRIFRSVALLSGATISAQAVFVLSSPVLTRLFTPDEFGALSVFSAATVILASIACLRYELAIPVAEADDDAQALTVLSGLAAVVTAVVTAGLVLVLGSTFTRAVKTPELTSWLWLLPLSVLASALFQTAQNRMLRERRFGRVGRAKLVQALATAIPQILAGVLLFGVPGLLVGVVFGYISSFVVLAGWPIRFRRPPPGAMGAVARRFRSFAIFSTGSAFVNTTGLLIPLLLLAAVYGPEVAGWFGLCQRVLSMPVLFVGQGLSQVFLAEAPDLIRTDPGRLWRLYVRTTRGLFLIGAGPLLLLSPLYPFLFSLVFGGDWEEAGRYALCFAPAIAIRFVVSPLATVLVILERQGTMLLWDLARLVLTVGAIFAGVRLGLAPAGTVLLLGAVGCVIYGVLLLIVTRVLSGEVKRRSAAPEVKFDE